MNYQMLVLDLDGTLTNSKKEVSQATLKALIDIQNRGKKSRSGKADAPPEASLLLPDCFVCMNSGVISCPSTADGSQTAGAIRSSMKRHCRMMWQNLSMISPESILT